MSAELNIERFHSRERMLAGLSWASAAAITCALMLSLASRLGTPWLYGVFGLGAALALTAATVRRLGFRARALCVLASTLVVCFYACGRLGCPPNAYAGMVSVAVVATLLLGRAWGMGTIALTAATVAVISVLQSEGIIIRDPQWRSSFDSTQPLTTLRLIVTFVFAAGISVVGVSYLVTRTERLVLERSRSLERLASEQAERERMQSELERTEAAYRKAAELEVLGRLAGSVAHDFNNALLVMSGALDELASSTTLSPEQREAVVVIRTAADQAAATTRYLRAFGPQYPGAPVALSLSQSVRQMSALLKRILPQNIEVYVEADEDVAISADDPQIQRVVTNLALNARDAMRDGGALTLRVRRLAGRAVLEVADTGSGMDDDVKQHLFEPFFTTKGAAGTGLGLASVRDLVEQQGGTIDVDTAIGRGTVFSLSWPAVAPSEPAPPLGPTSATVRIETRILLVDDEPNVRRSVARSLRARGFEVLEAADAEQGLSVARRHREPIHALVSDCMMPGTPVRVLVEGYRAAHPQGRVILCSGYAPGDLGLSLDQVDRFVPKPFAGDVLAREIKAVIA